MQNYTVFIGIDISKNWIDVCLTCDGKKKGMPHQRCDNNNPGFLHMMGFVKRFDAQHGSGGKWLFCMEHTGVYTTPLCNFLEGQGLPYVIESGLQISRSLGIRRGKDDKADAADIAAYIFKNHGEARLSKLPCKELLKIKHLLSLAARLKKANAALGVAAKELSGFTDEDLAGEVADLTGATTGHLKGNIKAVGKSVLDIIGATPELKRVYDLATSVIGVGPVIGANLLVITNGFQSFKDGRQFACYAGVAPFGHTSGSTVKKPDRVSHLADKKMKALLSNGALSAIQHDPDLRAYYQRKVAEGKNKYLVQNNVKNKLVHRIFTVVKRGTPYVELHRHTK